jgi:hypothetical protein
VRPQESSNILDFCNANETSRNGNGKFQKLNPPPNYKKEKGNGNQKENDENEKLLLATLHPLRAWEGLYTQLTIPQETRNCGEVKNVASLMTLVS